MEQHNRTNRRNIGRILLVYLGSAWVFIEALNFLIDKYNWHAAVLDVLILLVIFGLPASVIYAWFHQKFTRKAIFLQLFNGIVAISVIRYDLINADSFNTTELRLIRFKDSQKELAKTIRSIAILPFDNYTGNDHQKHLILGMHDALISELGQLGALRVISKTSSSSYANSQKTIKEIASELEVDGIIEVSVFSINESIGIQIKLISAFPEESQLWSKIFNADMSNVLDLYSQVVKNIAKEINLTLSPEEQTLLANKKQVDPEAYRAYLTGMGLLYELTSQSIDKALHYFNLALENDPNYAPAYAGIAFAWVVRRQQGLVPLSLAAEEIERASMIALALDSTLIEVHYNSALFSTWLLWDWEDSEKEFIRTLDMDPKHAEARIYYAWHLNIMKRYKEAEIQADLAIELQPYSGLIQSLYGMHLNHTRQFDKGVIHLNKTLKEDPGNITALSTLWTIYHNKGLYKDALETAKLLYARKNEILVVDVLTNGYEEGGYKLAMQRVAEAFILKSDTSYVTPWQIATLYTRAEINDKAIDWLEKAFIEHDNNMPSIGPDPIFDNLRDNQRFQDLLIKMNLPL